MQFRLIVVKNFVKENTWPELVPELTSVIQRSNLIVQNGNAQWSTLNALTVLQAILRPFQVRSYMPSALGPILHSFCHDLFRILDSLSLDGASDDGSLLRLKIAKRGLIIFSALVTRHRKHVDR
ncbi:hypothetical protein BHM03_00005745 [Ensete ventricosum]|nr:hypothetical protein BHM03_00005745 [Ensete ventricosum]